jgi:hypothetical protein
MTYLNHKTDMICYLTKTFITKLIQLNNPPIALRTPEFLQSIEVMYHVEQETFLITFYSFFIMNDFNANVDFLLYMKHWRFNGNSLFYSSSFIYPRIFFGMSYDGWFNLLLKLNECDASFF